MAAQQPLDCRACTSSSICMKDVLIIGHTGGIGRALADHYSAQGAVVTGVSRTTHALDYMNPASVNAAMAQIDGPFDRVIVASGALEIEGYAPEKTIQAVTAQGMARSIRSERNWPCIDFETHQAAVSAAYAGGGCDFIGACWIHRGQ